jgi:hypothetical protein
VGGLIQTQYGPLRHGYPTDGAAGDDKTDSDIVQEASAQGVTAVVSRNLIVTGFPLPVKLNLYGLMGANNTKVASVIVSFSNSDDVTVANSHHDCLRITTKTEAVVAVIKLQ